MPLFELVARSVRIQLAVRASERVAQWLVGDVGRSYKESHSDNSEILDCELTMTSPAAVNNTLEGLVPQQVIESAAVKHKRAVTMQQLTVTQGIGADSAFALVTAIIARHAYPRGRVRWVKRAPRTPQD